MTAFSGSRSRSASSKGTQKGCRPIDAFSSAGLISHAEIDDDWIKRWCRATRSWSDNDRGNRWSGIWGKSDISRNQLCLLSGGLWRTASPNNMFRRQMSPSSPKPFSTASTIFAKVSLNGLNLGFSSSWRCRIGRPRGTASSRSASSTSASTSCARTRSTACLRLGAIAS